MAGITTFMTSTYILVVNPGILSESGMDVGGIYSNRTFSIHCLCDDGILLANYPFALAPGMGLNAFFTYTVVF